MNVIEFLADLQAQHDEATARAGELRGQIEHLTATLAETEARLADLATTRSSRRPHRQEPNPIRPRRTPPTRPSCTPSTSTATLVNRGGPSAGSVWDRYGRDNGKSVESCIASTGSSTGAVDSGVLSHLLVVATLKERAPDSHFLPGVDVGFADGDTKEVDIFGVYEAKVSAAEFAKESQIRRDVELSHRLKADVHVMAAIDVIPEPLLEEAREHCRMAGLELLVLHEPEPRHGRNKAGDESRSSPRNGCHPGAGHQATSPRDASGCRTQAEPAPSAW
ncbi:hypothetical protein HYE82_20835 [Streptomyces sp. BR123]|uniref:hypothetical protein n=1 Tax=Streptomyces sp. BR123 TaxID=2749828 RepID=UPI0015C4E778|nr:hypothetical protein [Streptomyces sp. BR123]NXY96785.1 hypothetical protein [Streptomyces sp. BR123]